ncbi:hypothetical protein SAY87_013452 [Trapa incisa]|uniref:Strictosidine synthase conserved region domain-containing protein n=1 Tax=Trapa incisa TaxID=236973 RepID=A0AAN7QD46_9MYRT|nr:hypothetical protein SAY87_013452 [Trapa incisa]
MYQSKWKPPARQPLPKERPTAWPFMLVTIFFIPVFAAIAVYQYDSFEPAELPVEEIFSRPEMVAPKVNGRMLDGSERVGNGKLPGPEDLAYDAESEVIYTGCNDGWVKKVKINESTVEEWVNTGGRPLGVVLGRHGELIVADSEKGLLSLSQAGAVELLTDEAEGLKFRLTDGVDVAEDGVIYFTDASYKYRFKDFIWDILEGMPHGRLMSFDPKTRRTQVLVRHLYFANGVAVSPNQDFVVFCETTMSRCRRFHLTGEKKGTVDTLVEHLPGTPDNIRYDGEGHYWIGLGMEISLLWKTALRYPSIRKVLAIMRKYFKIPSMKKNGGSFVVDLEGKPIAHYHDPRLSLTTGAIKIGNYMYCSSLEDHYITRLDLTLYGAQ